MAGKILSIEVGDYFTRVCEMDYQTKRPKVYHSFSVPTPEGILADGVLTVTDEFTEVLREGLKKEKMGAKGVVFTLSSSKIAKREVKIPYCKENRIGDIVRANLADYFPIDVSQYMIAHSILETEKEASVDGDEKTAKPIGYKLLLLAVPLAVVEGYQMLAAALKLQVKEFDYSGNSVYMAAREACSQGTQLLIKVDERSSLLLVQKNGVIELNRTIPYGMEETLTTMMEANSRGDVQTYEDALRKARTETCIFTRFNTEAGITDTKEWEDKNEVTQSLIPLVGGISKVVDFYNANHSNEMIKSICLTGVGADFVGFSELLANEVDAEVSVLESIAGVNVQKAFKDGSVGDYIACIGAGMAPVHFYYAQGDDQQKQTGGTDAIRLTIILCIGCIVIGVALILSALIPYLSEKEKHEEYNEIIEELEPVYEVYLSYQALLSQSNKMKSLDKMTVNRNEELVEFISVLEEKMPASFCLNDLSATADGIVMNVTVETKEEAAAVLEELHRLESFLFADTTALSELVTEIGEVQYSFAVEMIYAPVQEETEGEE